MLLVGNATGRQLLLRSVDQNVHDKPQRQKVEFRRLNLGVGDVLDFIVHPRSSMDCDGVYIVDMQIWQVRNIFCDYVVDFC